jgi:hypothetical protein
MWGVHSGEGQVDGLLDNDVSYGLFQDAAILSDYTVLNGIWMGG